MLTEFEYHVLNEIAHHEMNSINGATPECADDVSTYCWADDFASDKMTVNQCKGVLSSLKKKGLINIYFIEMYEGREESGVDFTEEGFNAWKQKHEETV
jgi:hypothetical protein